MKTIVNGFFALGLGAAALSGAAAPAAAASWTQPGAEMGIPAGAVPPPGLYFVGDMNWGVGSGSPSQSSGTGVQALIWSPGWKFLGASYAASVTAIEVEVGIHNKDYLRGPFNPEIIPVTLSWNLGSGFFFSVASGVYLPINTQVTFSTPGVSSGAAFEQHMALSYIGNGWIASVNGYGGITTADAVGVRQPDYLDVDVGILREFGKWRLGPVAYAEWDLETTRANAGVGKAFALGVGAQLGYNFGPLDLTITADHQVDTHGDTSYARGDTRIWSTIVIPIWTPTPPAPQPLVAKY